MSKQAEAHSEETLDPEDWASMRALGHRMVDDMMDYIETIRDRPVWAPPQVKSHFEALFLRFGQFRNAWPNIHKYADI